MAEATSPSQKKTFNGSCHCGYIRYQVALPIPSAPEQLKAMRCNCTVCLKSGFTSVHLASRDEFKLVSPSSVEDVPDYQFRSPDIHRYFCNKCGVQIFCAGKYEFGGEVVKFHSVNILTLEQPQEGLDLSQWAIEYWDGRNDNWGAGKKSVPWPGGCI